MFFKRRSTLSGIVRERDLNVSESEFKNWQSGMLIQRAMPNLSVDDREFIISGVIPEEWTLLGEEDE